MQQRPSSHNDDDKSLIKPQEKHWIFHRPILSEPEQIHFNDTLLNLGCQWHFQAHRVMLQTDPADQFLQLHQHQEWLLTIPGSPFSSIQLVQTLSLGFNPLNRWGLYQTHRWLLPTRTQAERYSPHFARWIKKYIAPHYRQPHFLQAAAVCSYYLSSRMGIQPKRHNNKFPCAFSFDVSTRSPQPPLLLEQMSARYHPGLLVASRQPKHQKRLLRLLRHGMYF